MPDTTPLKEKVWLATAEKVLPPPWGIVHESAKIGQPVKVYVMSNDGMGPESQAGQYVVVTAHRDLKAGEAVELVATVKP